MTHPSERDPRIVRAMQAAWAHHQAGRLDKAEPLYRKLLDSAPDHPDALHLLGVIAIARGRYERAIQLIGRALQVRPDFPDAWVNYGNAQQSAGQHEAAIDSYRRAIALNPRHIIAHSNLARSLTEAGRAEDALASCEAAIAFDATLVAPRINRAVALKALGQLRAAAAAWRDAIAAEPRRGESHHECGLLLGELEEYDAALQCHDAAIALQPDNAVFHCARGSTLIRRRDAAAAAESFRRAVALKSDFAEAYIGLGWALRLVGRFDEAEQSFRRAREIDPSHVGGYRHIAAGGQQADDTQTLLSLTAVCDDSARDVNERIVAGFGLGRLLDNAEDFDAAFQRYAAANALARQNWRPGSDHFDAATFDRWVDLLIATYTRDSITDIVGEFDRSELPVFIVGMPRSGTTLVEQICASHSSVYGAGELHDIDRIATALAGGRDTVVTARAGDPSAARRLAVRHLDRLRALGGTADRVIDKMPDNIMQVGLIAALFPGARFIHCSRDARDVSLSCYFQLFSEGLMHFSYDLADCGRRCRAVERLAAHWLDVLPRRMLQVRYEELVADLEGRSRELIGFLGLAWEPACLEFHRTERAVSTVSHWQVRQPLYTRSVGRWRHYAAHLGPLLGVLDDVPERQ